MADLNREPDPIRSHRLGISYQTLRQTVVDQVPENKPASPNLTVRELRDFFSSRVSLYLSKICVYICQVFAVRTFLTMVDDVERKTKRRG